MSHTYRFFGGLEAGDDSRVVLRDDEGHHALHVVRVKVGDSVEVFDGEGNAYGCLVEGIGRKEVECAVESSRFVEVESPRVVVSLAWLNKDKAVEELIQRCTELGVSEFRFFRGEHSGRDVKELGKWRKWAVESCKQCGRVRLPKFCITDGVMDTSYGGVADVVREDEITLVASLGEGCVALKDCMGDGRDVNVVIGPEGDFSGAEMDVLRGLDVSEVSLGGNVYRSQVAAGVLCGLVLYELGRLE